MMPLGAAEIILFGIQAGVRLYGQSRQAYIDRTRERDLTLPLPGLDHASTASQARAYFEQNAAGRRLVADTDWLRRLHRKAMAGIHQFEDEDPEGVKAYIERYDMHRLSESGVLSKDGFQVSDIVALNTIAQWRRGDEAHPNAVRRIAGTLTEIGIDFFVHGPGAGRLAGQSPTKILLNSVLSALDDHAFVEDGLEIAVEKVFIATLDMIGEKPHIVSKDPKLQAFFSGIAKGVLQDVQARMQALPEDERLFAADRFSDVAQMVFRSTVRNGAEDVIANPVAFLGVAPGGEAALSATLGKIILNTVLPEDGDGVHIRALATPQTLDTLVKGALGVITQHPDLLGGNDPAVRKILMGITAGLAKQTRMFGPDLFPDIARLVLEQTAGHLDTLWQPEGIGQNLAVTAVATLLTELARKPETGPWRPKLSKSQLLNVVESVLDDLARNPAILTREVSNRPALEVALRAVLDALAAQELGRFSSNTAVQIAALAVQAVAERWEFLEELSDDTGHKQIAVATVIEAVLSTVMHAGEKPAWTLAQDVVLVALIDTAFATLAEYGINAGALQTLQAALDKVVADLAAGGRFSVDAFADDLAQTLAA